MKIAKPTTRVVPLPVECTCIEVELTEEDVADIIRYACASGYFSAEPMASALKLKSSDVAVAVETYRTYGDYRGHVITIQYRADAPVKS